MKTPIFTEQKCCTALPFGAELRVAFLHSRGTASNSMSGMFGIDRGGGFRVAIQAVWRLSSPTLDSDCSGHVVPFQAFRAMNMVGLHGRRFAAAPLRFALG